MAHWPTHQNGEPKKIGEMSTVEGMKLIKDFESEGQPFDPVTAAMIAFIVLTPDSKTPN